MLDTAQVASVVALQIGSPARGSLPLDQQQVVRGLASTGGDDAISKRLFYEAPG